MTIWNQMAEPLHNADRRRWAPSMQMIPPQLILASTSSIRRELLAKLGIPFVAVAPQYEERDLELPPRDESLGRARGKAASVKATHPSAVIVASDQLLYFGGTHLPKPVNEVAAAQLLIRMRGAEHRLYTSLVVLSGEDPVCEDVVVSRLVIHPDLTDDEIRAYVAADHPAGCAGGFKLESRGICLFSSIDTPDFTAILGLPMLTLGRVLRSLGYRTVSF
jgi:septum formation protein